MSRRWKGVTLVGIFVVSLLVLGTVAQAKKLQINVICWAGIRSEGPTRGTAEDYMAMYPDVYINVEAGPWEDFTSRIMFDVAAGTNAYDLVWLDPQFLGGYYNAGYVEVLDKYIIQDAEWFAEFKSDVYPQLLDGPYRCVYDDKWIGIPPDSNAGVFYYRKDVFENAGIGEPPKTWPEVYEVAAKIHNPPTMYAMGGMYAGFWAFDTWMNYLYSAEGRLYDPVTKISRIDDDRAVLAAQLFKDNVKYIPRDALSWGEELCFEALVNAGTVAMVPASWANPIPTDPNLSKFADVMGITQIPSIEGKRHPALGGFFWTIGARSPQEVKDQTWDFVKFYLARDRNERLIELGAQPFRISALNHPKALELNRPYYPYLADALENAWARPYDPEYAVIGQVIGRELMNILMDRKTIESALHDTAVEIWDQFVRSGRFQKEAVPEKYRKS